jgi:hypothetical protein
MGLTLREKKRLDSKGFPQFYIKHKAEWETMLKNARDYLDKQIAPKEIIRPDDLHDALVELIAGNEIFMAYLDEKGISQLYWSKDFCDYIIEQGYGGKPIPRGAGK